MRGKHTMWLEAWVTHQCFFKGDLGESILCYAELPLTLHDGPHLTSSKSKLQPLLKWEPQTLWHSFRHFPGTQWMPDYGRRRLLCILKDHMSRGLREVWKIQGLAIDASKASLPRAQSESLSFAGKRPLVYSLWHLTPEWLSQTRHWDKGIHVRV